MEDFFAMFYQNVIVGEPLFTHLRGWSDGEATFVSDLDQFPTIFGVTLLVAAIAFVLYYYIINHPRLNRWWHWLIFLGIVTVICYSIGNSTVMNDINNDLIAESLKDYISSGDAVTFGVYNAMLSAIFFTVLSACLRRWSRNCKHSPIVLLSTKSNNKGAKDHE